MEALAAAAYGDNFGHSLQNYARTRSESSDDSSVDIQQGVSDCRRLPGLSPLNNGYNPLGGASTRVMESFRHLTNSPSTSPGSDDNWPMLSHGNLPSLGGPRQRPEHSTSAESSGEPSAKRKLDEEVLSLSLGIMDNRTVPDWTLPTPISPVARESDTGTLGTPPEAGLQLGMEKLPAIPVWPPTLSISCQDLKGELYLEKLYVGNEGKLDPRTQSILWQQVWMTPREFEVQAGRGKHKNWKYSVRFNNRPVREVLSDIEKAFSLGYSRKAIFSGSEPPVINSPNRANWPVGHNPQRKVNPGSKKNGSRALGSRVVVHMATPAEEAAILSPLIRSVQNKPEDPAAFEHLLVDAVVESVRATMEASIQTIVQQALANEAAERQCLMIENESLRQSVAELNRQLQLQCHGITNNSFLSNIHNCQ